MPTLTPRFDELAGRLYMEWESYRRWLDMKIPALGDKTPKTAAKTAAGRAALEQLFAEFEYGESRLPEDQRFDVGILRKALGL